MAKCEEFGKGFCADMKMRMKTKRLYGCGGADSRCTLIPKAKPKLRRVKAWAWIRERDGKVWDACVVKWSKSQNLVPCTILIDAKYLKGKEQKK